MTGGTVRGTAVCAKCGKPTLGLVLDLRVPMCPTCGELWFVSVEKKRLDAITLSLVAEWVERERCEQLNRTTNTEGTND